MSTKGVKTGRRAGRTVLLALLLLLVLAIGAAGFCVMRVRLIRSAPDPSSMVAELAAPVFSTLESGETESGYDGLLRSTALASLSVTALPAGEADMFSFSRTVPVRIGIIDLEATLAPLGADMRGRVETAVEEASRYGDVYNDDGSYREDLLSAAFDEALQVCLAAPEYSSFDASLSVTLEEGQWRLTNDAALLEQLSARLDGVSGLAAQVYEQAAGGIEPVPFRYTIDRDEPAPLPDAACYGETEDPAVVAALLETPEARRLIGGQELCWSADMELLPGRPIRYYLDETILCIVWQEEEARAVGTFAEVFIADGSQLRRKIAGDEYENFDFRTTSQYAEETNAVLAVGGDFYHHSRACGIVVIDRQIYRFEPDTCDTCFITDSGDMLFGYRGQFTSQEQAQSFVDENDIVFSLCFGPVLIDAGQDVTPDNYRWGEVKDTYARSAIGLLGQRHYLTMNINCQLPNNYYLATLRQAADAMVAKGCYMAYTLDGGQTATTVFNCQLINPVQFGWEKAISDIIYFATALPE